MSELVDRLLQAYDKVLLRRLAGLVQDHPDGSVSLSWPHCDGLIWHHLAFGTGVSMSCDGLVWPHLVDTPVPI